MLAAFISPQTLDCLRSMFTVPHDKVAERLDNLWLLSAQAFDAVKKGEAFFTVQSWADHPDTSKMQTGGYSFSKVIFVLVLTLSSIVLISTSRAFVYNGLAWAGMHVYGPSLSMTVFKLLFGLYLRRGSLKLAQKYHVEARTLSMVGQMTTIPAPRAIDVLETIRFSYLLMTGVPGRPIGQMIETLTDEQVRKNN